MVSYYPQLSLRKCKQQCFIETKEHHELLTIETEPERWTIHFGNWHAHAMSEEDVVDICMSLLLGNSRVFEQHRNDQLAMTWSERFEDGEIVEQMSSMYLNPFDTEEWRTMPGDQWTVSARYMRIIETPRIPMHPDNHRKEAGVWTDDLPEARIKLPDAWLAGLLGEYLGAAPVGWHWTSVSDNNFCFVLPQGWRQKCDPEFTPGVFTYEPLDASVRLIVQTYYSPPESTPVEGLVLEPESLERVPVQTDMYWRTDQWQIKFYGPFERLWVQVTLYSALDSTFSDQFDRHLRLARRLLPNG